MLRGGQFLDVACLRVREPLENIIGALRVLEVVRLYAKSKPHVRFCQAISSASFGSGAKEIPRGDDAMRTGVAGRFRD